MGRRGFRAAGVRTWIGLLLFGLGWFGNFNSGLLKAEPAVQMMTLVAEPGSPASPIRPLLQKGQKLEMMDYRGERLWRIVASAPHQEKIWFFDVAATAWQGRVGSASLEVEFVASATAVSVLIYDSDVYRSLGLDRARDFPASFLEGHMPARCLTRLGTAELEKNVRFSMPRAFFNNRVGGEKSDFYLERWKSGWIGIRRMVLRIEPLPVADGVQKKNLEMLIKRAFRRILARDPLPEEQREAVASLRSGDLDLLFFLYNLVRSEEYHRTWYRPYDRTTSTGILFRKLMGRRITDDELSQIFESDDVDTIDSVVWDMLWRWHADIIVSIATDEGAAQ